MEETNYKAFFCWNCGEKVEKGSEHCPRCDAAYRGETKYGNRYAYGAGGVGWSDKATDPFFRSYAKKYTKVSIVWMIGLSILIPFILLKTGEVQPYGEGIYVLVGVPAIICAVGLIFLKKKFGGRDKSWDGIVENKTVQEKVRTDNTGNGKSRREYYNIYTVSFRSNNGKLMNIKKEDDASDYNYFNIGDRVRCHDTKFLKYIEKYDKTHDDIIFCAACGTLNDARDNYCGRCGAPMLKGGRALTSGYSEPACVHEKVYSDAPCFCKKCGSQLSVDASFCEGCGAKIER